MSDSPIDQLRSALTATPPANGVVGLLDNVLKLCQDNDLQLTWQNEQLRVRNASGTEEVIDAPLRKSVFRAALARIAVLCNEESADSVSPYGGTGSFSAGDDKTKVLKVTFVNTPAEQRLELSTSARGAEQQIPPAQGQDKTWTDRAQKGDFGVA